MDEKHLLKRCYRGLLPERVTGRRKQPYRAPIHEVLLNGDTLNIVEDLCSAKMIRDVGVFDEKKVSLFLENLKKRKKTGTEVEQMALCGIVSTQFIYGMFMKQPHYSNFTMKPPDRIICRGSSSRGQKPI
jgi:asparagine synthase (glutamine-hydrolysing)